METIHANLDPVFRALWDPTRRAVVHRLGAGPATVSDLAEPHDMGLPAFLKPIGVLEAVGLIDTAKSGRVRTCTLNEARLGAAEIWVRAQRDLWRTRHRQLDDIL